MIKPDDRSFLGGGLFADMFKDAATTVRDYIAQNGVEWENIIHAPKFEKYFTVQESALTLKNVPAGYSRENPQAEYLKFKSWYLEYPIKDEELEDAIRKHTVTGSTVWFLLISERFKMAAYSCASSSVSKVW